MPDYNTGTSWDQGLGALGTMLFPDPSKIAQAGYYGAEARKAQIEANKTQQQQQMLQDLQRNSHPWGSGPAPQYSAPGPDYPAVSAPPGPWPGGAPPSPPAPPGPGTNVASVPGQAAAPQDPNALAGPITNSMTGAPPPISPDLAGAPSSIQNSKQLPAYQPGAVEKLGHIFLQNSGDSPLTHGQAPPTSSPAAGEGAPVAPNATASDGSVPANDPQSGKFHPATLMQPSGSVIGSDPAAHNGSPAPIFDISGYAARLAGAGIVGEQATNMLIAYADEAHQVGMIGPNTYSQVLASLGRGTQLQVEGGITQQAMVTGEKAGEFAGETVYVRQGNGITGIPRGQWLKNPGDYQVVDPTSAGTIITQSMAPRSVFAAGPGGKPDISRTELVPTSQAIQEHRQEAPSGWQPTGKDTQGAERAAQLQDYALTTAVEKMYAAPVKTSRADTTDQNVPALSPEKQQEALALANKIFQGDERMRLDQKNFVTQAIPAALKQMQDAHRLPSPQEVIKQRQRTMGQAAGRAIKGGADPTLMNGTDVYGRPQLKFRIDVASPNATASSAFNAVQPPTLPGQGNVVPPPGTQTNGMPQAPQAQLNIPQQGVQGGVPMPGKPENAVVNSPQGVPMIVHNGVAVQMTAAEMAQYQAHLKGQARGPVAGQP